MDLQLALSLYTGSASSSNDVDNHLNAGSSAMEGHQVSDGSVKKRCFDQAFDGKNYHYDQTPKTLPLLAWNDLPEQIMDNQDFLEKAPPAVNRVEEDDDCDGVVGWPPINSLRKRICYQTRINCLAVENGGGNGRANAHTRKNYTFVKVKMEGMGIARKVDLSLHHSLHTLLQTLLAMFGKYEKDENRYKLSFQDKEGLWHLAEDVDWGNFIRSADRLQLWKKGY